MRHQFFHVDKKRQKFDHAKKPLLLNLQSSRSEQVPVYVNYLIYVAVLFCCVAGVIQSTI